MENYNKKLLMISGDTALAQGKKGAFYNTLKEFHKYWDRIDIIIPKTNQTVIKIFDNVFIHSSAKSKLLHPFFIKNKGVELIKKYNHDVMTVHEYPPFYNGIGANMLWKKTKIPYVLEIHHIPGYPKAADLKEIFYRQLSKLYLKFDSRNSKAVRVVNKNQSIKFLKAAKVNEGKIKYIPSAYIDTNLFRNLGLNKKYDLVFAARLEKNKGILNLIKAIEIVKKEKSDISLLIVGNGSLKNSLTQYVKENNLENNVIFSGWLESEEDVVKKYNESRIFINPSFNEGGPRVLLEAMACGLPIITTMVGVSLDLIKDDQNGLFINWDAKNTAEKINYLLNDKEKQELFIQRTRDIPKEFEKKLLIKNYANFVKSIL